VVEFSDCQVERLIKTLARRTRFVIEEHSIELYGRCPDCRQALDHGSAPNQARSIFRAPRKTEVRCA
jgi:ABC-type phosphate transport system ATPase subunit